MPARGAYVYSCALIMIIDLSRRWPFVRMARTSLGKLRRRTARFEHKVRKLTARDQERSERRVFARLRRDSERELREIDGEVGAR